ncbi:MAG: 16S rRNA (cytidine(1402)-2'-O)-methyltransferase [Peptococcaceae bacterium]|jgi:16S rRNA (cytidine1402-2'-O)-methyltransferase|nr:16S rRNA (cytidine(1402)-2'-O)-methyltransferase [Peptococcaceae bacterium]
MSRTENPNDWPPGVLYIVATPIGNLEDITLRALKVLGRVDIVAAEDTRRTGVLLKTYGIKKPLMSCFAHNEEKQSRRIIEILKEGQTVALVSDAGMPGISDPGARLVSQALDAGISLTVVPGPSAGLTALAASGLDTEAFAFCGFFPRETKAKKAWLLRFGSFTGTLVFYESPRRLLATLRGLGEAWGDRYCCVARELTKRYEEFIRGSLAEVAEELGKADAIKGEIVVVLEGYRGKGKEAVTPEEAEEMGRNLIAGGMGVKEASLQIAQQTGMTAKACYALLINRESP